MSSSTTVRLAFLLSLLLHLLGLFFVGRQWQEEIETRAFRARLTYRPRFEPPPSLPVASINLPAVQMEYLAPQRTTPEVAEVTSEVPPPPRPTDTASPTFTVPASEAEFKPGTPELAEQTRPSSTTRGKVDSLESQAMELLRPEDMAHAGMRREEAEKAAVIPDLRSRRAISGFATFTTLRLDGSVTDPGLFELTRYMNDHTRILTQVRHRTKRYFLSELLLKYPIHFINEGPRLGGPERERFTYFSAEELELLGRYLRSGGFLYASGRSVQGGRGNINWWLNEVIAHVNEALSGDGRYFEVPPDHPINHAFYNLSRALPGEAEASVLDVPVPAWYYRRGVKDRPGWWGVELEGELVALFNDEPSDSSQAIPEEGETSSAGRLMAMTNVVVYALTRPGGLTRRCAQPAWKQVRPAVRVQTVETDEPGWTEDEEIYAELGATLALVHAPLGRPWGRVDLQVRVDSTLELSKSPVHGLLLHNLPAGRHHIDVSYDGVTGQLEIDLTGGRVFTVSFSLNRLFFFKQLRLKRQGTQIPIEDWLARFSDLTVEEVYIDEEFTVE